MLKVTLAVVVNRRSAAQVVDWQLRNLERADRFRAGGIKTLIGGKPNKFWRQPEKKVAL